MSRFRLDLETMVFTFDPNWFLMLGCSPMANQGYDEFLSRLHPVDEIQFQMDMNSIKDGFVKFMKREFRIRSGEERFRWIEFRARILFSTAGAPRVVEGVLLDIGDKNVERPELSESERRFIGRELHDGLKMIVYRSSLLGGTWKIANRRSGKGVRLGVRVALEQKRVHEESGCAEPDNAVSKRIRNPSPARRATSKGGNGR